MSPGVSVDAQTSAGWSVVPMDPTKLPSTRKDIAPREVALALSAPPASVCCFTRCRSSMNLDTRMAVILYVPQCVIVRNLCVGRKVLQESDLRFGERYDVATLPGTCNSDLWVVVSQESRHAKKPVYILRGA